ncbi:GyrI-like domain-containing protein [Streptomyces genisteinicus]|uniref:GyrI-like domain-containing protein n=1 Tax=Streptomyces genisteinicus TaxID=2768068 RepID=A0A7H0HW05_9ACTN|nr:GyrI-like domain-containing protein [Streptomyces genisteinicus]QNP64721.1 GyrI-like domain-containing protein [Streptomyces genisteinicus]
MNRQTPGISPSIVERDEQLYTYIRGSVRMDGFAAIADRLPELIGWLAGNGTPLAGAPFFRYDALDMDAESVVEAGVPVAGAPEPEGDIRIGVLPAGRYVTVTHLGHPDRLFDVVADLREWAAREGLEWDMTEVGGVEHWACRLESYLTDPRVEPDPAKWEVELAFRLAD